MVIIWDSSGHCPPLLEHLAYEYILCGIEWWAMPTLRNSLRHSRVHIASITLTRQLNMLSLRA